MTAKVSGKTAVCSERQHKWAKLSLWRPSDLSERIPTCSVTFTLHLLILKDLWPLYTEDFPGSASSRYATFSLPPNSCEENNDLFHKISVLSLELAFLSNLFKCCIWVLLKHVQQYVNQLLVLRQTSFHWRTQACFSASPLLLSSLWSFQVRKWGKKTESTPCFHPQCTNRANPGTIYFIATPAFLIPPGKNTNFPPE